MISQQEIESLRQKKGELEAALAKAGAGSDASTIQKLSAEYHDVANIVALINELEKMDREEKQAREIIETASTSELAVLAEEDIKRIQARRPAVMSELEERLHPADPLDEKNTIMEIRAGAGGDEAGLFAAELFRAYARYAERRGWKTILLSSNRTGIGGFKEMIFLIEGGRG